MGALAAGLDPMFLRLLFLLLLALNLGAAAWLLFGTGRPAPLPPATDPGVPELRLLSEMPRAPPPRPAPPAASASGEAGPPADRCETLGPFQTQTDMRAAMQALSPHVPRIQYRQEQVNQLHGYWVYLPATADRESALATARALSAKGIQDYYVVTAGDQQNTISLGLFHNRDNAQRRLDRIAALGFAPKLKERVETQPAYWVDYALPRQGAFDWKTWLVGRSDLEARPVDCF